MLTAKELSEVCVSVLDDQKNKLDMVAARTRSKALEYWLQCELVAKLQEQYKDAYRMVVSEWYIPMKFAGTKRGMGECDIVMIHKNRQEHIHDLYHWNDPRGPDDLLGGTYIEIKTSIHNDFSPKASKPVILKRLRPDIGRIQRLREHAKIEGVEADGYLIGVFFDATPMDEGGRKPSVDQPRKPCLDQMTGWFDDDPELKDRVCQRIEFQDHYGIMACIWKR